MDQKVQKDEVEPLSPTRDNSMEGEGKPSKLDGQVEARPPPVHQHSSDSISSIDRNTTPATQQHSTDDMEKAARTAMILEEDLQLEGGFMSFPEKLMSLLEGGELRESMWWLPEGDAFCLVPENFDSILNSHFQGTKFESFTRKLNRWGFKRVTGRKAPRNTLAYFHHDFKEGKPDLLKDMSGSRARVQASRDNDLKRKAPVSQQEESSSLAGRQRSMYAAQLGASLMGSHGAEFNPPSNEKSSSRFFASISSASTESDRNLTFAIPQQQQQQLAALSASNELAEFARQREAAINAEIHLRFLTARRFPNLNQSPGDLLGDLGSTRVIGNTEDIPRSVLAGLAHGRLVSDQLWSSDVAASRASVSQQGSLGTSTSPQMDGKAARLLANSYVESSRTQPQPQATMLSGQLDSLTSDYWPTSRMPNLHTQSLIPDLTSRLSRDATRSTFDSNRNAPSHRFEHPIPQGQGDDYRAEQILQFYILQQQRHQQEEELRKRNQR